MAEHSTIEELRAQKLDLAVEKALRIYDRLRVAYAGTDVIAQAIVEPLLKARPDFALSYSGGNEMVLRTPLPPVAEAVAAVQERNRVDPNHDARMLDYEAIAASGAETGAAPRDEILRVTIVVRVGTTATQLTFAPGTKFEAGAEAVKRAARSLDTELQESINCPAWKEDFAPATPSPAQEPRCPST